MRTNPTTNGQERQNHLNYTLLAGILADWLAGLLTQGELSLLQPVYAPGKGTEHQHPADPVLLRDVFHKIADLLLTIEYTALA
jgi:hypothetical protein